MMFLLLFQLFCCVLIYFNKCLTLAVKMTVIQNKYVQKEVLLKT